MPILHPRPARTVALAGCQWFLESLPHLSGGAVFISAGVIAADYGAPAPVALPIGLLSAWPLGLVLRETVHSIRCWHIRQRRLYAKLVRSASDQRESTSVAAERMPPPPVGRLQRRRRVELEPARALVIEGQVVPRVEERDS